MFLQPSYKPQQPLVLSDPLDVQKRLYELDPSLDEALLQEANLRGYEARLGATLAHAPTAAGTYHWHEFVAALRQALIPKGWAARDYKNCPWVVSPDERIMLSVITGDIDTGKREGSPTNQAEKGSVLDEAIQQNQLFSNDADVGSGTQLWVLLYHVERSATGYREIRTELSLPSRFARGKIEGWSERIVLASTPLDPYVGGGIDVTPPAQPIDVPVERRRVG
ncbi:hypothetical protein ACOTH0_05125 [Achromobacter xylosoxidans]|uniref:hypothetical protein n=1 Tax=Achromobacter TaxID=222 RepID=UPI0006C10FB1|nr:MULTISPECIES: hypothetical protein [Achromobacter]MDD7993178.1 hypothetical protein [Achromobacter xylosoxidans]NEV05184.1 hypothetical protein [Achromobacter xylosoxidans]CAB3845868.1 hypothetical protein LMG1860_02567 [Achromobacter denitrificans]CUJ88850.1 Uncharacterised protein [Achromobacter xylosoxidans]